jgi:hypothetical protein
VSPNGRDKHLLHLLIVQRNERLFLSFTRVDQMSTMRLFLFVLEKHPAPFGSARKTPPKLAHRERFAEEIEGARPHHCDRALGISLTGEQDGYDCRIDSGQIFDQF